jgi:2-iminobutanoate/2-iminopropanoate deaminase
MKKSRNPTNVHAPIGSYVHQIELRGDERLLVLSGQIGMREDGSLPADPVEQLSVALENVRRNLQAAGMDVQDVIKLTFFLAGEMDTARRRQMTSQWFNGHKSCSTLVYVAALATPDIKVEIDAWASRAGEVERTPLAG